jgi:hypothetical protein
MPSGNGLVYCNPDSTLVAGTERETPELKIRGATCKRHGQPNRDKRGCSELCGPRAQV